MFTPIYDLVRYTRLFKEYLGNRIYIIFLLGLFAAISEGIGILMLLPLLETLESNPSKEQLDSISLIIFNALEYLGIQPTIISIIILIVCFFLFKGILTFMALGFSAILIGNLLKELKTRLFNHYSVMNYDYYSQKNTGYFANLINEQPNRALESFRQLTVLAGQLVNTIVLMALAFLMTWEFGLMALIVGLVLIFLFIKLNNFVRNLSRITATENGVLTKWLIQMLNGFKYLSSTSQINMLRPRIIKSISVLTGNQVKSGVAAAFTQSIREPLAVLFIMAVVIFQIYVFQDNIEPILVSIVLFYRALNSVLAVQSSFQGTFQTIGSMELLEEEFINQREHTELDGSISLKDFRGKISLTDVCFSYPNSDSLILKNINISLSTNDSIAIVGESGSGKSTLLDIITLLQEPTSGAVRIDNNSGLDILKSSWRSQIGYVSQDTVIFNDTIANNICMWSGDHQKDLNLLHRLEESAEQANILEFINTLPNRFETQVGDRGLFLSGGQKQRLFIAREIFRSPKLLILDEATSSLDTNSESEIQKSIERLKGKITLIVVAHRLSTIKNLDLIYVIKDGEIIESGNYTQLLSDSESYFRKMVNLQSL
tara:strand:- start:247 stop:2049 length:1803 start_codon:yes stop_codon:yes gene_type:complete